MLIESLVVSDDKVGAVDVLRFIASAAGAAVQPAEPETDAHNNSNHADSSSSERLDLLDASGAHVHANPELNESSVAHPGEGGGESSSAAQAVEGGGESSNAVQPANQADHGANNVEQILEPSK